MEKFTFENYLKERYEDQMSYYSSASRKNQKKYKDLQWVLIILSTITTIAAALPEDFKLKYVVVITSGLVTIITAGLKTFKYEELWRNYRSTLEKLKPQFYFYQMNIGRYGKKGAKKEAIFVETVEEILNKEQSAWMSITNAAEQNSEQKMEELQAKLDNLLRDKFNTQKPKPVAGETEPEPTDVPAEEVDAENPAAPETGETGGTEAAEEDAIEPEEQDTTGDEPGESEIESETADSGETGSEEGESGENQEGSDEEDTETPVEVPKKP